MSNRGIASQLQRMLERVGVRWRLLLAFFGISAFAMVAAAAAIHFSVVVGRLIDRIAEQQVPAALSALELSRQSERIVAAAPALLTVSTPAEHEALKERIEAEVDGLQRLLRELGSGDDDGPGEQAFASLAPAVEGLRANLAALNEMVAERLDLAARKKALLEDLFSSHSETQKLLAPWILIVDAEIQELRQRVRNATSKAQDRAVAAQRLDASYSTFRALRSAELVASSINDTLLQATVEDNADRLDVAAFRLRQRFQELEQLAEDFNPKPRAIVLDRIQQFRAIAQGPGGIPRTQNREIELLQRAQELLNENIALSGQLTAAVDDLVRDAKQGIVEARAEALSAQQLSSRILITIVILAVMSSVLIVWLYVSRNLVRRLIKLSDSMLAIARGHLDAPLMVGGNDEITRMAEALEVFRETAVEVRETNLREIREARRRLTDAIESISEGFALFDADDRLIVANSHYREHYPGLVDVVTPGVTFEEIIRAAVARGIIGDGSERPEETIQTRLARHRDPARAFLQRQADGRWIQISERHTGDRGRVAVYTDVTTLKEQELAVVQAKEQAERALHELKQTQRSLVQAEKLALLGQLAAGIAHEIKNPLNFVNNFSELSVELMDELKAMLDQKLASVDEPSRAEIEELFATVTSNLSKIVEHGRRADSIVKGMLSHSRGGAGERREVDINALLEESLNLAYHGARATDQSFNITLQRDFDPRAGTAEVVPQNLTRVFLNLFSNSFFATQQRQRETGNEDYEPTLWTITRNLGDTVEIPVRDNGLGIQSTVLEKIFTPFYSTKPAGKGTGLGLSISYDIIVNEHRGQIDVDTRVGEYTEFRVRLPRKPPTSEHTTVALATPEAS